MGRFGLVVTVLAALMLPGDVGDGGERGGPSGPPISVRIVPTSHREKTGRAIGGRFHVVVTNVSPRPIRLWRDWCSWGYFNLSFVGTERDGKAFTVKRKLRGWDKNYPDWMMIAPGDHMVHDVFFQDGTWEYDPAPTVGRLWRVRLRAEFEVPADDQTKEHGVWTGRVASPDDVYLMD